MRALATALGVSLRHVNVRHVLLDAVTSVAVGVLSALVLLLSSQIVVDTLLFESGLSYSTRSELAEAPAASENGAVVTITDGVFVLAGDAAGRVSRNLESGPVDLTESVEPAVWVLAEPPGAARDLLGLATGPTAGTVLVDEASAAQLGVTVGSTVALVRQVDETWRLCLATIGGTTRPYIDVSRELAAGLLVTSEGACAELMEGSTGRVVHFASDTQGPAGISKSQWVRHAFDIASRPQASGLMVPTLLIGTALWLLVTWRLTTRLRASAAPAARALHTLGVAPRALRLVFIAIAGVIVLVAAILSALGARLALDSFANFYVQSLHATLIGLIYGTGAILLTVRVSKGLTETDSYSPVRTTEKVVGR